MLAALKQTSSTCSFKHVKRDLIWIDDSWWTCLYACNHALPLRSRGKVDDLQASRVSRPSCCFLPTRCDFQNPQNQKNHQRTMTHEGTEDSNQCIPMRIYISIGFIASIAKCGAVMQGFRHLKPLLDAPGKALYPENFFLLRQGLRHWHKTQRGTEALRCEFQIASTA